MNKADNPKMIGSVLKTVEVLNLLGNSETGLGATEIGTALGYGASAVYHLLNTLKHCHYVVQDERTKKYYIGHGLFCLCATAKRHNKISNIAQPYLEHLVDVFGETSNLTILDGTDVVYVGQAESTNLLKMFPQMGARVPFYCTGGGKAMVAHLPEKRIEEILTNTVFRRFTDHTINDGEVLKRELKSIRIQGYAFDNEEREDGVTCIAAPVFDAYGIPVAAVSISGPTRRLRDKQFHSIIDELQRCTRKISEALGYVSSGMPSV